MTTEKKTSPGEFSTPSDAMTQNMARVEALVQRVLTVMGQNTPTRPALQGPGAELFTKAAAAYMNTAVTNPSQMFEQQLSFWGASVQNFIELQTNLCGNAANSKELPKDPRFANPLWESHPYFKAVRQQYLVNAEAMRDAVASSELDAKDHSRLEYFTQQIIDMASPTNFLGTNPDALSRAVETEGESLVKGLENLVRDLEANGGEMLVTLADQDAFTVGEDLATTPGKVVFRNRMFELIQYTPTTEKVAKTPLIIFPPWINKFYILDLKPKNSFVKWAVDQGQTVFVVSWVNPDETYADVTLDDYIEEGFLTAIEQVKTICDVPQVNAIGYCIAGTTLSITLGLMAQRGDTSVASATFFTTMTDFSDPGEVGVYLDNDFLGGIEAEVSDNGIMSKMFMSRTFSYLRANDLVYGPAIRHYMLGEAPPAFDLLYWNGDSTNLPGKMAVQYLRDLCQGNRLAGDGIEICGTRISLGDLKTPLCAVACETDHIAGWEASLNGVRQMGSDDKTFILAQSGHVAGIVNPPTKKKYGHYTNPDLTAATSDWRKLAQFNQGSWWGTWAAWLEQHQGTQVKARTPKSIGSDAPGEYVLGNSFAALQNNT